MKIIPRGKTGIIKCILKELFIQSVLLWWHWNGTKWHINLIPTFALLPKGFFPQQRKYRLLNPLIRVCEQGSHVQALLIFTHIVSEDEVAACVKYFCRRGRRRHFCFVSRTSPARFVPASKDEVVVVLVRFSLAFSRSFVHSFRFKYYRSIKNSDKFPKGFFIS